MDLGYRKSCLAVGERGFSLVELMVAMTVGLVLIAGLTTIVVGHIQSYGELSKSSFQMESGRFATHLLRDEISMAGFYGNLAFLSSTGKEIPSDDDLDSSSKTDILDRYGVFIEGANNIASTHSRYKVSTSMSPVAGTDVLMLRRASSSAVAPSDRSGSYYYVGGTAVTLEVIAASDDLAGSAYTFLSDSRFDKLRRYQEKIFFVDSCSVCSGADADTIPTLKVAELTAATSNPWIVTPLVEGIEDMQFQYGIDANKDGYPESFVDAPTSAQWPDVTAVRFFLLARNLETSPGVVQKTFALGSKTVTPADSYKRHVYTMTVRLRNAAERREDDEI